MSGERAGAACGGSEEISVLDVVHAVRHGKAGGERGGKRCGGGASGERAGAVRGW